MNRILVTAGLTCLIAAIVGGGLKAFGEDGKIFLIPTANITIDGDFGDWRGLLPVLDEDDPPNDNSTPDISGTDLKAFYLARDDKYLYLAITLYDGLPRRDLETWYFFVAQQQPFEVDIRGDMDAAVKFSRGNWTVWTAERGNGGRSIKEPRFYNPPSNFVMSGSNFIEWKVPWQDMGQLSGRFVRVYIHVRGQEVSEENLPGTELRLDSLDKASLTPDFRKLPIQKAKQQSANLRLQLDVRGRRYSPEPAETIIDQNPEPKTPLPDNRRVGVWLSLGQPEPTPDLYGRTVDEAKAKYPRIRVIHDARPDEFSDARAATIIGQTPSPGDPLPSDRRIGVWLSLGPRQITPQISYQGLKPWQWAGAAVVLLGLGGAIGRALTLKTRLTWERAAQLQWQLEATTKLPEPKKVCTWVCKTKGMTEVLKRWEVIALELTPFPQPSGKTPPVKRVEGKVLDPLTDGAQLQYLLEDETQTRQRVAPVVDALLEQILAWERGGQTPASIRVDAHLARAVKGEFGLHHCEKTGMKLEWVDSGVKWKGTLHQPGGEYLGILRGPTASEPDFANRAHKELEGFLLQLLRGVRFKL